MSVTVAFMIGGLILALLAALIYVAVKWGGAQIKKDFYEDSTEKARQALEIDERVRTMPDDERRKWLRGNQ